MSPSEAISGCADARNTVHEPVRAGSSADSAAHRKTKINPPREPRYKADFGPTLAREKLFERHGLTLGNSKDFPDRARLSDFGRRACGLSKAHVDDALARVQSGVERAQAEIQDYLAQHPDFARAGNHLIATFERGIRRSIAST